MTSSDGASYVFDTSSLVGGWVRLYPPDLFPGVWDAMHNLGELGGLIVPDEVLAELEIRDDDLYAWVKERESEIVFATNRAVMDEARIVLNANPFLVKTGVGRNRADPFVIATAAVLGLPVVSEERGGSPSKPKIPSVCDARGIICLTLLDVVRAEGWRF